MAKAISKTKDKQNDNLATNAKAEAKPNLKAKVASITGKNTSKGLSKKAPPCAAKIDVINEQTIEATAEIASLINDLRRLDELKKQLTAKEDAIELKVKNYMQDYTRLKFDGYQIATWKSQTRHNFDLANFKVDYPALHTSYLKDVACRVFKVG